MQVSGSECREPYLGSGGRLQSLFAGWVLGAGCYDVKSGLDWRETSGGKRERRVRAIRGVCMLLIKGVSGLNERRESFQKGPQP